MTSDKKMASEHVMSFIVRIQNIEFDGRKSIFNLFDLDEMTLLEAQAFS